MRPATFTQASLAPTVLLQSMTPFPDAVMQGIARARAIECTCDFKTRGDKTVPVHGKLNIRLNLAFCNILSSQCPRIFSLLL
jgi:hypothetical protein